MRVPLPFEDSERISQRAAELARTNIQGRGWSQKSVDAILPDPKEGLVGLRSSEQYLINQNRGFPAFVMWWAEGRVVPINDAKTGKHYVTAKGVGTPGTVTLPGGVKEWRDVRWQHPGLEPKNFLEESITQAIKEGKPSIRQMLIDLLKGVIKK